MTIQIALDEETNDIIVDEDGITRVSEGRFVVQQVRSKLQVGFGEWLLDGSIGWIARGDLSHNYDSFDIETRARRIIEETQGVLAVTSITSNYKGRRLSVSFTATTDYGVIDLTVPWSTY